VKSPLPTADYQTCRSGRQANLACAEGAGGRGDDINAERTDRAENARKTPRVPRALDSADENRRSVVNAGVTNVHYPTDRSFLQDGVRVLSPNNAASTAMGDSAIRVRNQRRSATRRVLAIGHQARTLKSQDALVRRYRRLMATSGRWSAARRLRAICGRARTSPSATADSPRRPMKTPPSHAGSAA
jgi:hypothetical protein